MTRIFDSHVFTYFTYLISVYTTSRLCDLYREKLIIVMLKKNT